MSPPPAIILVRPQLSETIGTTARAMMNCALTNLRLVAPRDNCLSEKAIAAASGAEKILEAAQMFDTTDAVIDDLQKV